MIGLQHYLTVAAMLFVLSFVGIIINRLNISVIAFKWYVPVHYVPSWQEILVTMMVLSAEMWVFRWVANRMPVYAPLGKAVNEQPEIDTTKVVAFKRTG